jgi:hypothetical protein
MPVAREIEVEAARILREVGMRAQTRSETDGWISIRHSAPMAFAARPPAEEVTIKAARLLDGRGALRFSEPDMCVRLRRQALDAVCDGGAQGLIDKYSQV